jgi:hypothetical protein
MHLEQLHMLLSSTCLLTSSTSPVQEITVVITEKALGSPASSSSSSSLKTTGEKRKRTTCTVALTQEQEAFKKSLLDRAATSKKKGIGHSDANYEEMFQLDPDVHQHIKFCDDFKGDEPELKSLKDGELSFYCIPCNKYDNSIPLF